MRLEDNLGLLHTLAAATQVVPAFIFDPRQIDPKKNDYFSEPAFHFLLNSLTELDKALRGRGSQLYVFYGHPAEVVQSLIQTDAIDTVVVNKDYTPFARKRDTEIADVCAKYSVPFKQHDDVTLSPIEDIRTGQQKLYTVFTPFMRKAVLHEVATPRKNNFSNYFSAALTTKTVPLTQFSAPCQNMHLALTGGRQEGLARLADTDYLKQYKDARNIPSIEGTSRLSAHHKFGTISIRETYAMAVTGTGRGSQFISELYWRDFYYYTAYHFPNVFTHSFLPWASQLQWVNDTKQFTAWCEGKTGVPLVDAGMRELNSTGWMHNRARMVVASYLTKNLLIDWRWGEKYFASKLIDYDPAQNNGGWQWSASVGTDPRPLRIFNPYTQAEKFDPKALYIKQWVSELAPLEATMLTNGKIQDFRELAPTYVAPLVNQKESYHRAMEAYKTAKTRWQAKLAKAER